VLDRLLIAPPLIIVACLALAFPAAANPSPEQSRVQAAEALSLLLEDGDRDAAIRAALKGLPANPDAVDLDAYPEAMSALWRAYSNRSVHVDWSDETVGIMTPDATRLLLSREVSGSITPDAPSEVVIVDPATGAMVVPPIVSEGALRGASLGAGGLTIAPGAGLFAVHFPNDGMTHVHRLHDGRRVASLPGSASQLRLSPDGRYLGTVVAHGLSTEPWSLVVREIATGAEVLRTEFAPGLMPNFAWVSQDALLIGTFSDSTSPAPTVRIVHMDLQGGQTEIPLGTDVPPGLIIVSPERTHFMLVGGPDVAVFDINGRQTMMAPSPSGAAFFLRDGNAVGVINEGATGQFIGRDLDVYALDGTTLTSRPSDFAMFDTLIYSPAGEMIGNIGFSTLHGIAVEPVGIPEGSALVAAAQAEVGTPAAAPLPEVDPLDLRSEEFAQMASAHLRSGDRRAAIVAALKGLPDEPGDADFARFDQAHLMLYRAMAARVLRVDTDRFLPVAVSPGGDRLAHGGPAPALYAMPSGARVSPLLRGDGSVYAATGPHFDPSGRLVAVAEERLPVLHVHDAVTGAHLAALEFPISSLADYAAYSSILQPAGFSHDGAALAVKTLDHIFVVDTQTWSYRQIDPPGRHVGFMSWLPGRQLLLVDPVYTEGSGPVAEMHVFDGTRMIPVRTVMSDDAALRSAPLYAALNRQGSALMAEEGDSTDGRVVVYDGAGQVRANVTRHDGNVQFARDGTAIAYHDQQGGMVRSLRVVSLETGEALTPEFQDHAVFDHGIFNARGDNMTWGVMAQDALRYRGLDVPTGRDLWDMAMDEIGADGRMEVAAGRLGTGP
jgi:hypothetical protein